MYEILYLDPMTQKVLRVSSEKLDQAVEAILKAKDELYYTGISSAEVGSRTQSSSPTPNGTNEAEANNDSASQDSDAKKLQISDSTNEIFDEDDGDWQYPFWG